MKFGLVPLLLFMFNDISGQDSLLVFPADLANAKTSSHINIKDTRLFIIPPDGIGINDTIPAERKFKEGGIFVNDINGYDYYSVQSDFTKARQARDFKDGLLSYREFTINNYPAKMSFGQFDSARRFLTIIFGDSTFLTRIYAFIPAHNDKVEKAIIHSLQTIIYDKSALVPPFTFTRFSLNDNTSLFKLAKYTSLVHVYSAGGVKKKSYDGQSHLIVLFHPAEEGTDSDLRKAISDAWETFYSKVKPVREQLKERKDSVNHFLSHELEVPGKFGQKDVIVFIQAVLVKGQIAVMQGICYKKEDLGELKKLTHSIKTK